MKRKLLIILFSIWINCLSAQLSLVNDISTAGASSSNPYSFITYNNNLYFIANTASTGQYDYRLFMLDEVGNNVTDISLLSSSSLAPEELLVSGSKLYLTITDSNAPIFEMHSYDGTSIVDVHTTNVGMIFGEGEVGKFEFNNDIYFNWDIFNLAKYDDNLNTVTIFQFPQDYFYRSSIQGGFGVDSDEANGNLIGVSTQAAGTNKEPFIFNPNTLVVDILDINSGTGNSDPQYFTEFNGEVYFRAKNNATNFEVWKTNGTVAGTQVLTEINTSGSADPSSFTEFNGKLYFVADNGINGKELWATDGSASGTYMVTDLNTGINGSDPEELFVWNNYLFFSAIFPSLGREVFRMNTSENIINLSNINPGTGSSSPQDFTVYNDKLYFTAANGSTGRELYVTNSFPSGTQIVGEINTSGSADPQNLYVHNDVLYFSANDGINGVELWSYSDPTLSQNEIEIDNEIIIFPNPSAYRFSINSNSVNIKGLNIYNVTGQLVQSYTLPQDFYDISSLNEGVYFIELLTSNDSAVIKKMIKK
ncbi:MAG: ELWxxDGT repeat protein [bacterium]